MEIPVERAGRPDRGWVRVAAAALPVLLILAASAGIARAADRVYWANENGGVPPISFTNLDGSGGGGDLNTAGAGDGSAVGVALYPPGGKVFWGSNGFEISFANLDGSGGGGALDTGGQPVSSAQGVAVDPTTGRIYWPNSFNSDGIYFTNLDGTGGGGQLSTAGATLNNPISVAVDPAGGRIYWANPSPTNKISFANLDGSGGGDINTTGATVDNPQGVALDPAAGRIYWANVFGQKISFANLDGSGGGDLNTTGATVSNPAGVSIDAAAGKIYWASVIGGKVSFARLDNSGGGDLNTTGATTSFPNYPVILKGPIAASAPQIAASGRTLSCSEGEWAPDVVASFLYRAPSRFDYEWRQEGAGIAAAGPTFAPQTAGNYRCRVSASNPAGSAMQTSEPFAVFEIGKAKRNRRKGTARLPITLPDPGTIAVTGRGAKVVGAGQLQQGTARLFVKARGRKRHRLNATGRARLSLSVSYLPAGLPPSTQTATLILRKR